MELHLDTCRVSWLCHWVLYLGSWQRPERLLSARPLLPWTLWSIKDQMVSTEHPSSHDAFIALAIKIDNRLREQEKWRRAVVPPNQRGHSTMQPSPCFLPIGLLRMSHALSDEWQPMWRLVHLLWWVGTFYGFLSSVSFPHPLTDIEVITSSQSHLRFWWTLEQMRGAVTQYAIYRWTPLSWSEGSNEPLPCSHKQRPCFRCESQFTPLVLLKWEC